ncbi:serine--tRNA ligase, partial [Candidatus Micrarchaeota archaeon]|nr:serine--tRNA ligase [Candidatus Micrarchaeota archaeon]
MLDIKIIRENPTIIEDALRMRNANEETFALLKKILSLDSEWRNIKKEEENLRSERNKLSMLINDKKKRGEPITVEITRSGEIANRIKDISIETTTLEDQIKIEMLMIPNIPDSSVPVGKDETQNPEVRTWGSPKRRASDVLDHHTLGEQSRLIDFERGVKLAEHRFTVLYGPLAKLERAIINFMLAVQTTNGYREISPPYLVNTKTMIGTGQ